MIKPFNLGNIKKISKHEVELIHALYEFLPATDIRDKLHVAIRKALMKHLGQDIRYFLSGVEKKTYNEFAHSLPDCPVLVVLGLAPIDKKIIVEFDFQIANVIINKLLGEGGSGTADIRPLTETEQGVLQYLIMQILSQIHSLAGSEPRVHFRFDKFAFRPEDISKISRPSDGVCVLIMEVTILEQSGFVRLAFPYPFLEELLGMPAGAGNSEKERIYFRKQLENWGFVKTSVWAEAGNALLSAADMNDLEAGDVVLFDETSLEISKKKLKGDIKIHFGSGEGAVESGIVSTSDKKIKCKLNNINR